MESKDKKYFIKLIVLTALANFSLTFFGVSMLLEWQRSRIDRSAQYLKMFNEKMISEDSGLQEFLNLLQIKHNLDSQDGVGAEIVPRNEIKKEN